ncbi:Inosine triphosphate pyrophosphatase [Trachipleistophora hominis]|uniref:Inosine triphosphate pyrophosphatase n=1 Tax=Trachipleistophora hominis TaxID=72359 RepID=L7JSM6_TRAHO|nr:Inosine triphosphate pyrophosphatase [Trachipleistophora hominis]
MKLFYFSSNVNKYNEIKELLPFPVHFQKARFIKQQQTLDETVLKKLKQLQNLYYHQAMLVDSTSLEIAGLHGLPGPYIDAFLSLGYDNIEEIVKKVGRRAKVKNVLGLALFDEFILFDGVCDGTIVETRGEYSSGFDKIFMLDRDCYTLAEHVFKERKVISPRGHSVFYLLKYCEKNKITHLFQED